MEIRYQDSSLERLEADPKYLGGFSAAVVSAFRKRINFIRQATNERDLYAWKSLRIEKLKGDRKDQHSMRLNDQWRLIFTIEASADGKYLLVISIEDYHD
jgi:toxin HigB-1